MNEKRRLEGFKALLSSDRNGSYYLEDMDGSRRLWRELSPQRKLENIAQVAAMYNVPFERFAEEVWEEFRGLPQEAVGDAALRMVLHNALELRGLGKLLPDDGRTESTPLVERFKQILDHVGERDAPEQTQSRGRGGRSSGWLRAEPLGRLKPVVAVAVPASHCRFAVAGKKRDDP